MDNWFSTTDLAEKRLKRKLTMDGNKKKIVYQNFSKRKMRFQVLTLLMMN